MEQVSTYWRDHSRKALQYPQENCESIARLFEAAARDEIPVAIARANVEIQYLMHAQVQEMQRPDLLLGIKWVYFLTSRMWQTKLCKHEKFW